MLYNGGGLLFCEQAAPTVLNTAMTSDTVSSLESTIEQHIDSTSRLVRQVDLALSLLIVLSLVFGGLFLAILADHWLLKEGLSMPLRLGIFTVLFAATGFYIYRKIVPLFLYPINPIYTAALIEQEAPSFKNSLINWLLLRQERLERTDSPNDKIGKRMYDGIVQTAAVNVQTVPAENPVDFNKLIWMGTFLAVLLALFVGYAALSPKNPFTSLIRVFVPFGGIERPQAAQFRNVFPGDATVLQGETTTISAEVVSRSSDPVYLVFSTDDGQAVKQRIPMSLPEGKRAFETLFPPGRQGSERGFNSSIDYWIVQGESRSKQYRIDVLPAASVEVVSLQYDFPNYTGLPQETIEHGGDIRALEGTTVTVAVRSTLPLEKIDLVFDDNPANHVGMKTTNDQRTEAKGTFTLKLPFPHKSFSLRATDENGNASRRSGIYRIEVVPDQPPKVQWADTATHLKDLRIDLPVNQTLQFPIQAEDPDFALRYLYFKTESTNNKSIRIPDVSLLNSPTTGPTEHRGQIKGTVPFLPADKRLNVGDTVEVWVEAKDTKYPEANTGSTLKITVNVIDPTEEEQKKDQDQKQEQNQQQDQDRNKGEDKQPQQGGEQDQPQDKNDPKQDESKEDQKGESDSQEQQEQNPDKNKEEQSEQGNQEQKEEAQNQKGEGQGEQSGNGDDGSNQGKAGNERSENGDQGSEEQGGEQDGSGDPSDQQAKGDPQGTGDGGEQSNERRGSENKVGGQGGEQEQESAVNPETQDGDAMERIVDQMKKEGKFDNDKINTGGKQRGPETPLPGANPMLQNDNNQILRNDTLDPNSKNRRDTGNDPSNPQQSDQRQEGNPKEQQDKPGDNKGDSEQSGSSETDSRQPNESGKESGQSGTPETGGDSSQEPGQQNGKQQGAQGAQSKPDNQSNSEQNGEGSQQAGSTGGGSGADTKTAVEDPNLEYANKVTNLVLEYLADQLKDKPNDALLERLGWTEEQLQQFHDKWQKMLEESRKPQQREDGKDYWTEALKSLGLNPNRDRTALQGSQTTIKDTKRVTEGHRIEVPPAIRDQFKRYNEGIGK